MKRIILLVGLLTRPAFCDTLALKAPTAVVRGEKLSLQIPPPTITGGPLGTARDLVVNGKTNRLELTTSAEHAWAKVVELDFARLPQAAAPRPPGNAYNFGVRLSDRSVMRKNPYLGFASLNSIAAMLNLTSPHVRIWSHSGPGWTGAEVDLVSLGQRARDIEFGNRDNAEALSSLKKASLPWFMIPRQSAGYPEWSRHVGIERLPWCNDDDCCQWVAVNKCPPGTVIVSGGCEFNQQPYITNKKPIAPITVNTFRHETNSWHCEAWQQDMCTFKPILFAHAVCMNSDAYVEVTRVDPP